MFGRYHPNRVAQEVLALRGNARYCRLSWEDLTRKALAEQGVQATEHTVRTVTNQAIDLSGHRRLH